MKRVMLSILSLTVMLVASGCGNRTRAAETEAMKAVVSDAKSGFCIANNLPLYDLSSGGLKWKANCILGEKLSLLGHSSKAVQSGRERDFVQVERDSGATG
jgi:hypothetical protein